jgi:hypothetical protein
VTKNQADANPLDASSNSQSRLRDELEDRLTRVLGAVIGQANLYRSLGFPTAVAFRRACHRGTLTIHTFAIQGRRGRFALAHDVAAWLVERAAHCPDVNTELAKIESMEPENLKLS